MYQFLDNIYFIGNLFSFVSIPFEVDILLVLSLFKGKDSLVGIYSIEKVDTSKIKRTDLFYRNKIDSLKKEQESILQRMNENRYRDTYRYILMLFLQRTI